jgi:hypothetical protein
MKSEGELLVLGVGIAEAVGERLLAGRIVDGDEGPRPGVRSFGACSAISRALDDQVV